MNQIGTTHLSYNKRYLSRCKEHIWMRPISNNVKLYSDQRNVSRVMSPIWRSDLCLKCGLSRHWSMQNTFSKNNVCWNKAKRQKLLDNYIVNPWQTLNLLFCAKKVRKWSATLWLHSWILFFSCNFTFKVFPIHSKFA